jgi:hypothetical protein
MSRTRRWSPPRLLGIIIIILLAVIISPSAIASAQAGPMTAESPALSAKTWRPVEITLHAARTYANPYTDADVSATFTSPQGQAFTMPGFWDGGDT